MNLFSQWVPECVPKYLGTCVGKVLIITYYVSKIIQIVHILTG